MHNIDIPGAAKFTAKNIKCDGEYVIYVSETGERQVMARFKYAMARSKGLFKKTIIKSGLTVKEYFARVETSSPIDVAEEFGFVPKHIAEHMERYGFPVTPTAQPFVAQIVVRGADPVEMLNRFNNGGSAYV
jgi:hypothetical protein